MVPRLQDGGKLPKWVPRSRRAQYLVSTPLHASTVVLVRNLQNGNIVPQFHFVFDDYVENLNAGEYQEPPVRSELINFKSFNSAYDDEDYVSKLSYEWLELAALEDRINQVLETHQYPSSVGRVAL